LISLPNASDYDFSEIKTVKKVSGDSLFISSISLPKAIKSGVKKVKEVKKV